MTRTDMTKRERHCIDHPGDTAIARCAVCRSPICNVCFKFRADEKPACPRCAFEISSRPRRFLSIALSLFGLGWGSVWFISRRPSIWADWGWQAVAVAAVATLVAGVLVAYARPAKAPAITHRPEEPPPEQIEPEADGKGPYRARLRRVLPPPVARVSATSTVGVLVASLVVAALILPRLSDMPRWVEAEIVLVVWWVFWTAVLSTLLYRGFRLADDWVYFTPWDRKPSRATGGSSGGSGFSLDGCDGGCAPDGEGCVAAIVIGLAVVLLLGAAWVLVELAVPILFLLAYALIHRALRQVAHDRHGCEGRLLASIGWGAMWSAIYVAPLAGVTFLIVRAIGR